METPSSFAPPRGRNGVRHDVMRQVQGILALPPEDWRAAWDRWRLAHWLELDEGERSWCLTKVLRIARRESWATAGRPQTYHRVRGRVRRK